MLLPPGFDPKAIEQIQLYGQRPDVPEMNGKLLEVETPRSYDLLLDRTCQVNRPDGSILCILLKKIVPESLQKSVIDSFRKASVLEDISNRGMAAAGRDARVFTTKKDGTVSKTSRVVKANHPNLVKDDSTNGIIGFSDASSRFPYCRQTAFTYQEFAHWKWVMDYLKFCSDVWHEYIPDRWQNQKDMAERTHPAYVVPDTPFTTVTVNRNWQTRVHTDKGDYIQGNGVMGVLGNDNWDGCHFVYPRWRIAVNLKPGDLILNDVHEYHGNTPIEHKFSPKATDRISIVQYYRADMVDCKDPIVEEAKRKAYYEEDPINRSYAAHPSYRVESRRIE